MFTSHVLPAVLGGAALVWGAMNLAASYKETTTPPAITGQASYDGPVQAGGTILLPWVITKTVDCPGASSRVWYGQDGFQLTEPQQSTAIPMGVGMRFNIQTAIPDLAPSGPLKLEVVGSYQCPDDDVRPFRLGPVLLEVAG